MRPPPDYAPPNVPIDLPDDFGTDEANRGDLIAVGIAAAILLAVVIAAAILIGAFAS